MSSASRSNDPAAADRLAWFDLGPDDLAALRAFAPVAGARVDDIVAEFYQHLLRFPPLAALLQAEPGRLERLTGIQRRYLLELTEGRFDAAYVASRLRVGDAHQRMGVAPVWYMGGFALLLRLALRALVEASGDGRSVLPTLEALIKAVFLDMSLAMRSYIESGYVARHVARDLEQAAQVAEEALAAQAEVEHLKDDLTRMVVHDLKNPVSGIAMLVQLVLRKGGSLPERQRHHLEQIDRTCREMMRLIQNLLEISKIEEGKMPVVQEAVALRELAEEVMAEYQPIAEQASRAVRLEVAPDAAVALADRALLKRVLINLVVNALRHSGSRDVRLTVAGGPAPDEVTLSVIDYGHGIAPEDRTLIFEKFRTARRSPSDEPASDTGLGLPFCKLAVERMGGRIALDSSAERTAFSVTLPAGAGR